jgi:RNA polymerase sigma-70 factor (ECF subfamily)
MLPAESLERYRPLLHLRVRQLQLDPRLKRLWDSSEIVQDVYVKALENLDQFEGGQNDGKLVRWLQRILENVVKDKIRAAHADKRDIDREQAMEAAVTESSLRFDAFLADGQPSPSERVEHAELLVRVAAALDQLPAVQRDVIIYHHLHGAPVAEIAGQMGKTESAVAMLLYRGKCQLRKLLAGDKGGSV